MPLGSSEIENRNRPRHGYFNYSPVDGTKVTVEPSGKLLRIILSGWYQFVPLAIGDSIPVHTSSLPACRECQFLCR